MKIRLIVADDHAVLREALAGLIDEQEDMSVVGQAADGREAVALVQSLCPDVALLDLGMPRFGGIWALEQLRETPETRCLILSMTNEPLVIQKATRAGACGYVTKDATAHELLEAIRAVARGRHYFNLSPTAPATRSAIEQLSERERDVFRYVALGHTSKEIGEMLSISPSTVDVYRSRLMKKIDVSSRADLVQLALANGLLTPKPPPDHP